MNPWKLKPGHLSVKLRTFSKARVLNIAKTLSQLAAPLLVLLIQYLDGSERVSFNQLQVTGLDLKLNGRCLRGNTEGPVIPSVLELLRSHLSSLWFLCPTPRVIAWFWALGFCSALCTRFQLEIHSFCTCWHPVSKQWRETVLSFVLFRKGSSYSREVVAWMICDKDSGHYMLVKWEVLHSI